MNENIAVSICVCTFRRPHITDTLNSILQLNIEPHWDIRIIVADNDDTDSAKQSVLDIANKITSNQISIKYIHAPARNISIARNACLNAATTPLIAFIDDDELVTTGWLNAMLEKLESSNADAVLGPVKAIYNPSSKEWLRGGDFHSTYPVWVRSEIISGYSCNVLIKLELPALKNIRFRENLGISGGEDTVYFSEFHKAGGIIVFSPDAVATETVTPEREKFVWLLKRRFRSGQTHGLLIIEGSNTKNVKRRITKIMESLSKISFCFVIALANFINPIKIRFWLLRGVFHVGVAARLLGKQEITLYG